MNWSFVVKKTDPTFLPQCVTDKMIASSNCCWPLVQQAALAEFCCSFKCRLIWKFESQQLCRCRSPRLMSDITEQSFFKEKKKKHPPVWATYGCCHVHSRRVTAEHLIYQHTQTPSVKVDWRGWIKSLFYSSIIYWYFSSPGFLSVGNSGIELHWVDCTIRVQLDSEFVTPAFWNITQLHTRGYLLYFNMSIKEVEAQESD